MTVRTNQMEGETRCQTCKINHVLENVTSAEGYIYAIVFESVFGDNVSSSRTSTRTFEQGERQGNDRLYIPDRTFSAWHAKNMLCESYNKMIEENTAYVSYPVIDYWAV
jgi:hypothetical protein